MILHIDMDAFYASVEQRDHPELRGKPVIVGGSPEGRGVVTAASYEARKYGVHSAMPTSRALQLCPHAIRVKTRMSYYAAISQQIREIFHRYTPHVEPLSLDEAFLDVAGCELLFGTAEEIGREIKRTILEELQLIASVGVAPNKFLAKLASDLDKPDGFTVIHADRMLETLAKLPISRLWGVGKVTEQKLQAMKISTFGHLQQMSQQHAAMLLGNSGAHFWRLAHGIDERPVVSDRAAKTISHEHTFPQDIDDLEILLSWLLELTEQVCSRLRRHQKCGRTIQLKIRYSDFHTVTRSRSLPAPCDSTDGFWPTVSELVRSDLPSRPLKIRLLGVGVSKITSISERQLSLIDEVDRPSSASVRGLDRTTDAIRKQFGDAALRRASTLRKS